MAFFGDCGCVHCDYIISMALDGVVSVWSSQVLQLKQAYKNLKGYWLFLHAHIVGLFYDREDAKSTNIGSLLERRGMEFLGTAYKDPISSYSAFQEFSVSIPEVCISCFICFGRL